MSKCTSIDPLVTPYVDGELPAAERTLVDEHLHRCPPCHSRVAAESAVRDLVRARKPDLTGERAPANLHTQCTELADRSADAPPPDRRREYPYRPAAARASRGWWAAPWHLRVVPLALTASLVAARRRGVPVPGDSVFRACAGRRALRGSHDMLCRQQPVGDARCAGGR